MIDNIYLILNFEKYNIYIWSSFFITFLVLFIHLIVSIIMHDKTKTTLKKIYENDKNK